MRSQICSQGSETSRFSMLKPNMKEEKIIEECFGL